MEVEERRASWRPVVRAGRLSEQTRGDGLIRRWKPDFDVVRATIEFARDTGRLQSSYQDPTCTEEKVNERTNKRAERVEG